MSQNTNIYFPKSPFLDGTGRPSREWIQWLQNPNFLTVTIGGDGALPVSSGGTGINTIPAAQQILIGNGSGYILGSVQSILPAFSGDASTTFGNTVITLATVNGSPGVFGSASVVPVITVNGKGLITSVTTQAIQISSSAVTGTITNNNASAGFIGEYSSASLASGSALALTTATPLNVISLSLTAGDWMVTGVCGYHPAGSANVSYFEQSISTTSGTIGALGSFTVVSTVAVPTVDQVMPLPSVRISIAATTTVYLVAQAAFTVGTVAAYGFISARRMR